jgi:glycosyltransferase involved in cell wall biosynthesis/lipopolysaccharide/colanic/teichoic acid biosynthesis glycosyltransferase
MKIAIAHDYLIADGGAEKCLKAFTELFPEAPVYTLFYHKERFRYLERCNIKTSFLDKIPFLKKRHHIFLPLYAMAVESLRLKGYDLILSSSWAWTKGVKKESNTCHICFCHTPMRFAHYKHMQEANLADKNALIRWVTEKIVTSLKKWDLITCGRVDYFIATCENVRGRIKALYNRDSVIIHSPVETDTFVPAKEYKKGSYYLLVSRLVPYKKVGLAISAFNTLKRPLKIVGIGGEKKKLKNAAGPSIEFAEFISRKELVGLYQDCKALICPQEEDWGIAALEAQSCGKPVIAYGKGGALEYVVEKETGHLFFEQTPEAIVKAVEEFEEMEFDPVRIRENVLEYDQKVFEKKIKSFVLEKYNDFKDNKKKGISNDKIFPYGPASLPLREKYKDIFELNGPIKERLCKLLFDKIFAIIGVVILLPVFIAIAAAYLLDGLFHSAHRGPMLASYRSKSQDKEFVKYKFNLTKGSAIDKEARRKKDFSAYLSSYNADNLTCVGKFLKRHYLDEIPQIFNILKGDISFVGIRPLAAQHYLSDIKNGHPRRQVLKAGVFSQTHVRKGTPDCGNPELDYEYIKKYMTLTPLVLIWLDITIMARGALMVLKGEKAKRDA